MSNCPYSDELKRTGRVIATDWRIVKAIGEDCHTCQDLSCEFNVSDEAMNRYYDPLINYLKERAVRKMES